MTAPPPRPATTAAGATAGVSLEPVTTANRDACAALGVTDDQAGFVAPNARSLSWAEIDDASVPLAICAGGRPVGFALYTLDPEEGCWIHRFMIDRRFQRRGYGRAALALLVERLAALPGCDAIRISAVPENAVARRLYASLGFEPTGEITDGEVVMRRPVAAADRRRSRP